MIIVLFIHLFYCIAYIFLYYKLRAKENVSLVHVFFTSDYVESRQRKKLYGFMELLGRIYNAQNNQTNRGSSQFLL
jgi:hypothetical protein